jgi:dihydrofolate synthase / folylpolyglutamate synthase
LLVIDGAHNHAGAKALTKTITDLFPNKKPIFLVSVMKDKQVGKMLNTFRKIADQIIFTQMPSVRGKKINELNRNSDAKFHKIADESKAFDFFYSLLILNKKSIGIITGSLFFSSHIKKNFLSRFER